MEKHRHRRLDVHPDPVHSAEYDYAAHMTLELERWDGQVKRYESQSSAGTAHYQLFGAPRRS